MKHLPIAETKNGKPVCWCEKEWRCKYMLMNIKRREERRAKQNKKPAPDKEIQ